MALESLFAFVTQGRFSEATRILIYAEPLTVEIGDAQEVLVIDDTEDEVVVTESDAIVVVDETPPTVEVVDDDGSVDVGEC